MSENKKDESIVDVNVALVLAENKRLIDLVSEKDSLIEDLTKRLSQATDLIENDSKSRLIADIKPMTTLPSEYLGKMSIDDLGKMKRTLQSAAVPAFKAGTPMADNKYNPKKELDNMFDNFASSTWRKS
jgi:hypothetical protein